MSEKAYVCLKIAWLRRAQLKELEEAGMEVTYPDIEALKAATASVYDDFYAENDWGEDLVTRIRAKIEE